MKKILALIVALVLCLSVVALVACNPNNNKNNGGLNIETAEEFYAFGAVSIATMIDVATTNGVDSTTMSAVTSTNDMVALANQSNTTQSQSGNQNGNASGNNADLSSGLTEEQMQIVNELMALAESLMDEGSIKNTVTKSDREGYAIKSVVSFTDMLGNTISYTLYYNETEVTNNGTNNNNTSRDRDDDDDDWFDNDKNEQKQRYTINGIMIVDEQEYPIEGNSIVETESGFGEEESSKEMYFVAYTTEDKANYIKVNHQTESETEGLETENEQEVVYSVYQNKKLVQQTIIEQEQENNEQSLKVVVIKDGVRNMLDFEDETKNNGNRVIDVKATLNGESVHFKVWVTTNDQGEEVYRYQFKDGYQDCHRDFWDD